MESDLSNAKPIKARRTHRKSRLGCANCKKRHIKVRLLLLYFPDPFQLRPYFTSLCALTHFQLTIFSYFIHAYHHYVGNTASAILFPSTIHRATQSWLGSVRRKKTSLLQLFKPSDRVRISWHFRVSWITNPRICHWAASGSTPKLLPFRRRSQTLFQTIQDSATAIYPVDWNKK